MRNLKTLFCPSCIVRRECLLLCFQIGLCGSSYCKFGFYFRFWFCANLFQILTLLIAKARTKRHQIRVSKFFFLDSWKSFARRWKIEGGGHFLVCFLSTMPSSKKMCKTKVHSTMGAKMVMVVPNLKKLQSHLLCSWRNWTMKNQEQLLNPKVCWFVNGISTRIQKILWVFWSHHHNLKSQNSMVEHCTKRL